MKSLTMNGLAMPDDFPSAHVEEIYKRLLPLSETHIELYAQCAGAWNALSYRYLALVEYADAFSASLAKHGSAPSHDERYRQERQLFGFFSNGFSAFEALFYGMFAVGSFLDSTSFPLSSPKDERRVSASRTVDAYAHSFADDPIVSVLKSVVDDRAYTEWKEVRNVLTHRTAPGRILFVGIDETETPADQWKLFNITLDQAAMSTRREQASAILARVLAASERFVFTHF